jgi:hypothetical protein
MRLRHIHPKRQRRIGQQINLPTKVGESGVAWVVCWVAVKLQG